MSEQNTTYHIVAALLPKFDRNTELKISTGVCDVKTSAEIEFILHALVKLRHLGECQLLPISRQFITNLHRLLCNLSVDQMNQVISTEAKPMAYRVLKWALENPVIDHYLCDVNVWLFANGAVLFYENSDTLEVRYKKEVWCRELNSFPNVLQPLIAGYCEESNIYANLVGYLPDLYLNLVQTQTDPLFHWNSYLNKCGASTEHLKELFYFILSTLLVDCDPNSFLPFICSPDKENMLLFKVFYKLFDRQFGKTRHLEPREETMFALSELYGVNNDNSNCAWIFTENHSLDASQLLSIICRQNVEIPARDEMTLFTRWSLPGIGLTQNIDQILFPSGISGSLS